MIVVSVCVLIVRTIVESMRIMETKIVKFNGKLWSGHGTLDEEDMKALMTLKNLKRFATKEEMQKIKEYFYDLQKWHDDPQEEQTNYAELKNDLD